MASDFRLYQTRRVDPAAAACADLLYSCGVTRTSTRRLAEVAQKVGVSEATVSRVLNGRAAVSDATREAVLTALDVLGYERPTQLPGEHARLIGLVLPKLQNPIFPALAEVIGRALAQRGFTPVLCTRTAGGLSAADYFSMLLDQQVSGVVFAGGHYAEADAPHVHNERLPQRKLPVVLFNAAIEEPRSPQVSTDDAVAVDQAYGHLASLGHERIGLILGPQDHVPSRRKLKAYTGMVKRAGRSIAPELVEQPASPRPWRHAGRYRAADGQPGRARVTGHRGRCAGGG